MHKTLAGLMAMLVMCGAAHAAEPVKVKDLTLDGKIEGENIVFTLKMKAEGLRKGTALPLVLGDVAYIDGRIPSSCEVTREGDQYMLVHKGGWGGSSADIEFRFASRPVKNGDWRETSFSIPSASIRKLSVECDRDDLEVKFPGALDVQRQQTKDKKTIVTAFLGLTGKFAVNWKPEIKKFDSELVVSCEASTIATASVGALKIDSIFTYRVIQGELSNLTLALPDVNVTQVRGENIQEWKLDKSDPKSPKLIVNLSRPEENVYRLQVESEMVLPKFPSKFDLPVFTPQNVLRTSGFLLVGTDSAIKLQVSKIAGLTQIDQASFPAVSADLKGKPQARACPSRSTYAYQYANVPYTMEINADDIVTSYSVNDLLSLSLVDNDLVFNASVELEVKDAPAREIMIETDADNSWTVTSITGANVSEADVDVRESAGKRLIYIPFSSAVSGTVLVNVKMEKSLAKDARAFAAPRFTVLDAKTERGFLVVAGEKGIRLNPDKMTGLREVHTGSVPTAVKDAQHAFRFKSGDWTLNMMLERTKAAVHSESFHLVSLGEGVMYCSVALTYHITGAPVQEFVLKVPEGIKNFEFTGADIESWKRDGELCTVRLQTRIMGDYTLLITYDRQFNYYGGEAFELGSIETQGTESEVGYIAVASHATVKPEVIGKDASTFRVERDEIPSGYAATVNAPVIASFKFVSAPHKVNMKVTPYEREQLLGQVVDYVKLETKLSKDGESVTTATYYIKNASRQYLVLKMPKNVNLWTVKYIHPDGTKEVVQPQQSEDGVMVPVMRPRDPNTALEIEAVYAQKHGKLGLLMSGLKGIRFQAPSLPETHTAFAGWKVAVPEDFVICGHSGNVAAEGEGRRNPFVNVLRIMWRIAKAPFRPGYSVKTALTKHLTGSSAMEYTGSVVIAAEKRSEPLKLGVQVVPQWMGGESSPRTMALLLAAGLFLLIAEARKKRSGFVALAVTLLVAGAVQFAAGRSAVAALGWAVIALLLLFLGFKGGFSLIGSLFRGIWRGLKVLFRRRKRTVQPMLADDLPLEPQNEGFVSMKLITLLAAAAMALTVAAGAFAKGEKPEVPPGPVMEVVTHSVKCPTTEKDTEKSADASTEFRFEVEAAAFFMMLPADNVLTDFDLSSRSLEIVGRPDGYYLKVDKPGEYTVKLSYRLPVVEQEGRWLLGLTMPQNIRNNVRIVVPEAEMEIAADQAVLFKTEDKPKETIAEAVFGPVQTAVVTWRPRVRKTKLEEAVFFSEVNTYAALQAGVIDFANVIRYQIAQGEVRELKVTIPAGMSVTAVRADGVATWSFDPEKRLLDVVLERAVSGDFTMSVVTQIACDGLPYKAAAGVPIVIGSARQRGAIAFAAPENVQVRIDETAGLNQMNIEDFSSGFGANPAGSAAKPSQLVIRKAYRYNKAEDVTAKIEAEQVLSEVRVAENGTVSISDERIVLATKIDLSIAKAGIFSAELWIPEDYEVETLTGRDVSHWDELKDGRHGAMVFFNKQVTSATDINIVAARTEKGIEGSLTVPRVEVKDAAKHSGRMTVSGERGIRLMVDSHSGVDIRKASEEGIRQTGVIVFDVLRPNWEMVLKTDVLSPVVKPEILQVVKLTEGMLHCRNFVKCHIENAGVKTFLVKAPVAGIPITVAGKSIARVHEIDREQGIWQVDLHNKVENLFDMTVTYQIPYNPSDKSVTVRPVAIMEAIPQKGYIAVTSEGRIQVKAEGSPKGLKPEDARSIPGAFQAGDLSEAVLCYGTVDPDYELGISVVRHDAANVLPASINKVTMTSTMSNDGELLTRVVVKMTVGELRLLTLELPRRTDRLWTVLVNSREVATSRAEDSYVIPLEAEDSERETTIDFVYAGSSAGAGLGSDVKFEAPRIGKAPKAGLPLSDIEWNFFVLPGHKYYGFGGTMDHEEEPRNAGKKYTTDTYASNNLRAINENIEKAKQVLDSGEQYVKEGKQKEAKRALQEAVNYSQADADLNEDARVQYRNLVKQQVKIGLLNRRDAVRYSQNIIDEQQLGQMEEFKDGEYTQEYAARVERNLTSKDNDALEVVADKMIEQQTAAAGVVSAIRVSMPEHGKLIKFYRARHIEPEDELSVSFKMGTGKLGSVAGQAGAAALIFLVIWAGIAIRRSAAA